MKLFSLKNFTHTLNEAPKAHCFFLLLIQSFAVQQKSNKATLKKTNAFSTVKLALCVQSLCLLPRDNFLFSTPVITAEKVRIICGRCQITIPGSLEGLGFRGCYSASAQSSTARF